MDDLAKISGKIKKRRIELGLSYHDLAKKTGISASTLQRYETGYIKNLPIDKFEVIADALDVDPAELMGLITTDVERLKIGAKIQKKRNELSMPLEKLAQKLNISFAHMNRIERGTVDMPYKMIIPLCKALKISPSYLLGWEVHEDFDPVSTLNKKEKFEYDKFMEDAVYYFNDETISNEDKKKLLDSLNNIFFDIILGKKGK
ncbi:helix-turn-helix domain-containing protein [Sebaldella sp. S0638]|uniref:helix-turn-helix domain-containing protein n=1 Tax=Sebaldella sp. S0638 TaxID=2957809 RepID=UPI00209D0947|nr:helix-turn-helix transcriptional regulator [Sebaldella sp. S0638]MCP1226002.1 helix-turn-helix domain-containing protein [Sebaldella sp. S0638]